MYCIIDLEMNPVASKELALKNEIIQIAAVMLDEEFKEVDRINLYVKPQLNKRITPQIYKLTKITTKSLSKAPFFDEAIKEFVYWLEKYDDIEMIQWSSCDWNQIKNEMKFKKVNLENDCLSSKWLDLQASFSEKAPVKKSLCIGLDQALFYLGFQFSGKRHNALYDALNEARILRFMNNKEAWSNFLKTYDLEKYNDNSGTTLGDIIDFSKFNFE